MWAGAKVDWKRRACDRRTREWALPLDKEQRSCKEQQQYAGERERPASAKGLDDLHLRRQCEQVAKVDPYIEEAREEAPLRWGIP